jgi:hypothetical protein
MPHKGPTRENFGGNLKTAIGKIYQVGKFNAAKNPFRGDHEVFFFHK